jgi:DNA invertase Pin-like site-specific DNA recombinase
MASNGKRSQKTPKRKGDVPLDELLATHSAGNDRLTTLRARYGAVVPASRLASKSSTGAKLSKTGAKKARGTRLVSPDDSQVIPMAEPRLVGYARVSTDEQSTRLQLDALRAAGCAVIHEDSASGVSRSRPGLTKALTDVAAGDTLVVWRLDRLGRSLRDLLDISEMLRERAVALRSLTDHIDTATAAGRMLYAVLGAVAQFERDVLRERTVAGMKAAKSRGEHIGRPPALTAAQIREAKKMLDRGESPNHIARILRVGRSTLYRAIA